MTDPVPAGVDNDVPGSRFVVRGEGGTAELTYAIAGSQIILKHTEVPKTMRGGGIAGQLARTALEYAATNQLGVIPVCPYVIAYLTKHPEFQKLVKGKFVGGHDPGQG